MSGFAASMNQLSAAWAALAWTVIWQSTLLALLVEALCLVLHRASPNLRLWLWQIVAIKLLIMPFWTPAISILPAPQGLQAFSGAELDRPSATQPNIAPAAMVDDALLAVAEDVPVPPAVAATPSDPIERAAATEPLTWASWLMLAWLSVAAVLLGQILVQRLRLCRFLGRAEPLQDEAVDGIVRESAAALGLTRIPVVLVSAEARSPFVCGLLRTSLVLAPGLEKSLDLQQLRQAVLHELAHLKRRDLLWSWLPELVRIVYWAHPVAHWVRYRTRLERELACDQLAMAHSGRCAASYADMLVRVVSHISEPNILRA